jgi:hypothetical protein
MNDDGLNTRERARKVLDEQRQQIERSPARWDLKALAKSEAVGINMVAEETGHFGPWDENNYDLEKGPPLPLDDVVRDRLIVHARQDIASTYALTRDAYQQAYLARRNTAVITLLVAALVVLNIFALIVLWFRP